MDLEQLKAGIELDGDSGNDPKVVPEWMDHERFKRGQSFFIRHLSPALFALHVSIAAGFGAQRIIEPIAFNKKSDTGPKARLRYIKTFIHAALWHLQDVWDETTLAHKSIITVRKIHKAVREGIEAKHGGKKRFVTQYDMALVQVGFIGAAITYPKEFGINCTREELEDYVFCWRGLGYLLGIKDEYNICSGGYEQAYRVSKQVENEVVYGGLLVRPPDFEPLANAYVAGTNIRVRFTLFTKESLIYYASTFNGQSLPWLKCTWMDYGRVMLYRFFTSLFWWLPGFERLMNYMMMQVFEKFSCLIEKELSKFSMLSKCPMNN